MRKFLGLLILLFVGKAYCDMTSVNDVFEQALTQFNSKRGFPGAVICIYQENTMILNQAYGTGVDVDKAYPLASCSKIFTRSAIEKLIKENILSKEDSAWNYLDLSVEPKDPRIKDITIGQLLDHRGDGIEIRVKILYFLALELPILKTLSRRSSSPPCSILTLDLESVIQILDIFY